MARRGRSRRSRNRRSGRAAKARTKAQRAAKKRVAARKAAGKKPSGAKSASQRKAENRAKAQAAAKKRIASGRTISQTKAANQAKMRAAAAERNRKFQAEKAAKAAAQKKAAEAKKKADAAAAKKKADAAAAKKKAEAAAAKKRADEAAAKKKAEAAANKRAEAAAARRKAQEAAKVEKPTGNLSAAANIVKGDPFARPGPGGPEPEADYTSYQSGSYYNQSDTNMNPTNFVRSARNVVTEPLQSLGINTGLTNTLIPKSNEAIQDTRDQRSKFNVANTDTVRKTKSKGSGGGVLSNMTPPAEATTTPVEEILETLQGERYEPAPPPSNLNQLQIDSYNTALESYNAGQGFTGQGVGTGFGNLSQPVIQALIAGTRGRKRFRYGARSTERGGGSGTGLRRGSQRFQQFTTQGQLNI